MVLLFVIYDLLSSYLDQPFSLANIRKENEMKTIKLTIGAILLSMYGIALSDNGIVKLISWGLFIGLFMVLVALLEKRYVD